MEPGTCHTDLSVEEWKGEGWGQKNDPKAKHPTKIVGPNYEETMIAQKASLTKDNKERKLLDRTAKNSENQSHVNRMIKRRNKEGGHQDNVVLTSYWAHEGDASKADRAWAKWLTADHPALLVVNCVKYILFIVPETVSLHSLHFFFVFCFVFYLFIFLLQV